MRMFDYAFYSLYTLYLKKEKKDHDNIESANYAVFGLKAAALLGIGILSSVFYEGSISERLGISKNTFKILGVTLFFIYYIISKQDYTKRLPQIIKKYRNHPRNKWFRPWMLYFVALGFVLIPIFIIDVIKAFT